MTAPMPEWWGTGPLYLYAARARAEYIASLLKANGEDYRVYARPDGLYWLKARVETVTLPA